MAQGVFKELVTTWGFDVDMGPLEKMEKGIHSVQDLLKHTGEVAITSFAGLFGIADFTAATGYNIAMTAQRLDVAADAYQKYGRAARMMGVDQEGFNSSLTNFNNLVEQIPYGGEGGKILGRLGISPYANGQLKNSIQLLDEIGEKFKGLSNREAGFFTHELFGRPSPEMVNFLKALGEQGQGLIQKAASMGGIFSDSDLDRSKHFHDEFEKLKYDFESIGQTIGLKLMPPFEQFMKEFESWTHDPEGRQFLFHDLPGALANIVVLMGQMSKAIGLSIKGWNDLLDLVRKGKTNQALPTLHADTGGFWSNPFKANLLDTAINDTFGGGATGRSAAWDKIHANGGGVVHEENHFHIQAIRPEETARAIDNILRIRRRQTNQKTQPALEH